MEEQPKPGADAILTLPLFPLAGALLFPGAHLPLRIFEPRYVAMVHDAMDSNQLIGLVQPRDERRLALFDVGAVGEIIQMDAIEDGAYAVTLRGKGRFRIKRELEVSTPYRQVEGVLELLPMADDAALPLGQRAALESEAKRFAAAHGFFVDWKAVRAMDDEGFVNGIAQVAPFDAAAKQALLEAPDLLSRAEMTAQLLSFFTRHTGGEQVTLH